ncbi:hypothetical protein CA13_51400 [Planctomycetes bacterium CA13]|uniref:Cellulose-binding protein n=1 Tax=Novipirellula herctigrandis TaxID=2527986 RepID=A0A5C5ZAV2_9BACT|nr:hypothetical protein CA13_51400 [Planctomycetes bacterium CA13]
MHLNRRRFFHLAATTASVSALPSCSFAADTSDAPRLPIGMNLAGIADYEPGFPFKNLMWGARAWLTRNVDGQGAWNTEQNEAMAIDANGYPVEVPFEGSDRTEQDVFTILPNVCKPGRYVLVYEGEGQIDVAGRTKIVASAPGRIELEMAHAVGDGNLEIIRILRSQRGNHLRNIRIVAAEFEQSDLAAEPFLPEVVDYCKQFHALRFMDWLGTNDSINVHWANRKTLDFFTQTGTQGDAIGFWGSPMEPWKKRYASGVAIELCVDLANAAKCDAWVCVPHMADDQYITEMAKLVRDRLDPSLKVYVEYSNEVWNWQFQQAHWNLHSKRLGELLEKQNIEGWKQGTTPEFNDFDVAANQVGTNFPERLGIATHRIHALWEKIFVGIDRNRLVRVAAGQAAWLDITARCLRTVLSLGKCDAMTVAGYFGPSDEVYEKWAKAGPKLTSDQVIQDMQQIIKTDSVEMVNDIRDLCQDEGVDFLVYEGGQHIQPKGQEETSYMPALKEAQFSAGMHDCYLKQLKLHADAQCRLYMAFSSIGRQGTRYGSWGHLQRYDQPISEMPKMRALVEANTPKSQ